MVHFYNSVIWNFEVKLVMYEFWFLRHFVAFTTKYSKSSLFEGYTLYYRGYVPRWRNKKRKLYKNQFKIDFDKLDNIYIIQVRV